MSAPVPVPPCLTPAVTLEPWAPATYWGEGLAPCAGRRLLILGESHYGAAAEWHARYTVDTVAWHTQGPLRPREPYFWRIARLVASALDAPPASDLTEAAYRAFWQTVAFANAIQHFVAETPGGYRTEADWASARAAVPAYLAELAPDRVLVTGAALWRALPPGEPLTLVDAEGCPHPARRYARPDGRAAVATVVHHPASHGWSPRRWQPRVAALLAPERRLAPDAHGDQSARTARAGR